MLSDFPYAPLLFVNDIAAVRIMYRALCQATEFSCYPHGYQLTDQ